jgi:hypothetical protein
MSMMYDAKDYLRTQKMIVYTYPEFAKTQKKEVLGYTDRIIYDSLSKVDSVMDITPHLYPQIGVSLGGKINM